MFEKGTSGNPLGRPSGSRNKLRTVLDDVILADAETVIEDGRTRLQDALDRLWRTDPVSYVKLASERAGKALDVSIEHHGLADVQDALQAFTVLSESLGAAPLLNRRQMRQLESRVIEHDPS